ncbi:DNA-binding response regulator [Oceanobacillus arenosus]|uniref:DNA-binding response regulator n=1 Tax=Oceanobacillus arenosus TaxID=1229153 RepID=A0A3D8Q1E9_9BACI|nr:response regulator transcription factor [Oceanobacillus arenosus]RDW21391.1 DNA-binding response regulator [Oceanobacillus arenosus]
MSTLTIIKEQETQKDRRIIRNKLLNYKITLIEPSMISYLYNEKYRSESALVLIEITNNIDVHKLIEYYSNSNVKIGLILSKTDEMQLTELFKLEVDGYFLSDMEIDDIISAINLIENGDIYVHPKLIRVLHQEFLNLLHPVPYRPKGVLTNREWEVLEEISKGYSNKDIGSHFFISEATVKNHVSSLLRKLKVNDRTGAIVLAIKNGYILR